MNTKELIALNNDKRPKLTDENEAYYSDILLYVRLKLQLSEHQSEEILMEILDHLLEAQADGKTAQEVFGQDPIRYAETLMEQLPKERKRNLFWFFSGIAGNIIGIVLIIRGLLLFILSNFLTVNYDIPLMNALIITLLIIAFIISVISFIVRQARKSLIKNTSMVKGSLLAGLYAAVNMAVLVLIVYTLPEMGWSFHLSAWVSIVIGAIVLALIFLIKKIQRK